MTNNPNHHLAIHGHFYQPPRENPWLGVIEDQESAKPFSNWNSKICAECYTPLTCSPIFDDSSKAKDLFNCYAHISYNFGPTLLSWLEKHSPFTLERLQVADKIARNTYEGHGTAIAQVYSHQILPLSDARDRHTQILWGIKEFEARFKRKSAGMWLSETAVDMNTVRTLIDHGIKFIILSPLQASSMRKFGDTDWTNVPDGTIDTRIPYRIFEVDGGGRTHFNRYIDVLFYDKEISTKISFEHLLSDQKQLEWLIRERYSEEATLPQLVLIATDGEIYGHHEKNGNRGLSALLDKMLLTGNTSITNLELFLKNNQPSFEVKLWDGDDGRGSSWSCEHGVGRWYKDCGCSDGSHMWNQEWRTHLRNAFDDIRHHVRLACEDMADKLLYDFTDARNDYISIILEPNEESRERFLQRHAKVSLSDKGKVKLWKVLEADRNAMLMYTSCGWFFSDISGCEPQQNMRYALRAAELIQEFSDYDQIQLLKDGLRKAISNYAEIGTGEDIFDKFVMTSKYSIEHLAAVSAIRLLHKLDLKEYNSSISLSHIVISNSDTIDYIIGSAECFDQLTRERSNLFFMGFAVKESLECGVCYAADLETAKGFAKLPTYELLKLLRAVGISLSQLPYSDRKEINDILLHSAYLKADENLHEFYHTHKSLFEHLTSNNLPVPSHLKAIGEEALSHRLMQSIQEGVELGELCHKCKANIAEIMDESFKYGLTLNKLEASRVVAKLMSDRLVLLLGELTEKNVEMTLGLLSFIQDNDFWLENWEELLDRYWRILHLPPRQTPGTRKIVDDMRAIGARLFFSDETLKHLTQVLFSTPV